MKESEPTYQNSTSSQGEQNNVRRILLSGIFWRILLIEAILLVWSLGARRFSLRQPLYYLKELKSLPL